tara:strand:- start:1510 stop:1653 length:144 start_codon:yes stop_codon:yes gene_type:complete
MDMDGLEGVASYGAWERIQNGNDLHERVVLGCFLEETSWELSSYIST